MEAITREPTIIGGPRRNLFETTLGRVALAAAASVATIGVVSWIGTQGGAPGTVAPMVAKGTSAGYLPQDGLSLSGRTVFAECMSVFAELRAMEQELETLTHSIAELDHTSAEYSDVADRYHRLEHEFRTRDGYSIEAEVGRILMGLGFSKEDWQRQTDEFSGGWQMRLALVKLLLQKPTLLLLDEPTNHLDLEARNWLEEYLHDYPHSFVLISHDRYFLDVTVNKIAEIWNKRFWFYTGNYDKFLSQKTQREKEWRAGDMDVVAEVDDEQIGEVLATWTGIPVFKLTEEETEDRDSPGRNDHPLLLPAAEGQRPHCGRVRKCGEKLWRERGLPQRRFHDRTRRPDRTCRCERSR